jgi:F0F1-type ATP synthase membrane subunit b/b'
MEIADSIIRAGQIAGALSAILALLLLILKFAVVKPITNLVDARTIQIQKSTNGGRSLTDVALGVARVERKIEVISKRVETLENTLKAPQSL